VIVAYTSRYRGLGTEHSSDKNGRGRRRGVCAEGQPQKVFRQRRKVKEERKKREIGLGALGRAEDGFELVAAAHRHGDRVLRGPDDRAAQRDADRRVRGHYHAVRARLGFGFSKTFSTLILMRYSAR